MFDTLGVLFLIVVFNKFFFLILDVFPINIVSYIKNHVKFKN